MWSTIDATCNEKKQDHTVNPRLNQTLIRVLGIKLDGPGGLMILRRFCMFYTYSYTDCIDVVSFIVYPWVVFDSMLAWYMISLFTTWLFRLNITGRLPS